MSAPRRCIHCGRSLRRNVAVCDECAGHHTVTGPRDLITPRGTLGQDPQYGGWKRDRRSSGGWVRDKEPVGDDTQQREQLARWYASCGRSVAEIVDLLREYSVSEAQVRRWAGREIAQYNLLRKTALDSDLVRQVKKMRVQDLGRWRPELAQLWVDYRRDRQLAQWIVLEECVSHIDGLCAKAHHNLCEACDRLFLATRRDARACSPKCRKWLNHEESTHNRIVSFIASLDGRGEGLSHETEEQAVTKTEAEQVIDRVDQAERARADMEARLAEALNAIGWQVALLNRAFPDDGLDGGCGWEDLAREDEAA